MARELAKKSSTAVGGALASLRKNITNTRQALPTSSTMPILKMGKDGYWTYGADNVDITDDAIFAANPLDVKHGFVCWTDYPAERGKKARKNTLKGEVFVGMSHAPIDPSTLPEYYDDDDVLCEWTPAAVVPMVCIAGDDDGEEVSYRPSSLGGTDFVDALLEAVGKQIDEGSDQVIPHLELLSTSYDHPSYGKTYKPTFEIVGWSGIDDADVTYDKDDEEEPEVEEEKPKRRSRSRAKAKPPEDEVEEEKPKAAGRTRSRRRRS